MKLVLILGLSTAFLLQPLSAKTELGIAGTKFTINGKPTFLLGISYYAALGASDEFVRQDLEDMRRDGFNWIRVWADWAAFDNDISAVTTNGAGREPYLSRLQTLLAACDEKGMIVDITLAREKPAHAPARLLTLADHQRAVQTLVEKLRPYRNWYLDLGNERNIRDSRFVSMPELKDLRATEKKLDSGRLITASHSSDDDDLLRQMEAYLKDVRLDFIALHRPREKGTAAQTEAATSRFLEKMKSLNTPVPILYQEPFRRGYGNWEPQESDFFQDLHGAVNGGAAGWCFHNGAQQNGPDKEPRRSFDLSRRRLYDQLDDIERKVVHGISEALSSPPL